MPKFGSNPPLVVCDMDTGFAILLDDDGQLWKLGMNSGKLSKIEEESGSTLSTAVEHLNKN